MSTGIYDGQIYLLLEKILKTLNEISRQLEKGGKNG